MSPHLFVGSGLKSKVCWHHERTRFTVDWCNRPKDDPIHSVPTDGNLDEAVLPYAGTSGWSGSDASRDATVAQDADGRTLDKQQEAVRLLAQVHTQPFDGEPLDRGRKAGLTWRELDRITEWGHGSTSRVLSDLHKAGAIARLTEQRNRCSVYVLPEYVNGRETAPHGGKKAGEALAAAEAAIQRVRDIHQPLKDPRLGAAGVYCDECMEAYPCDTIMALDDE